MARAPSPPVRSVAAVAVMRSPTPPRKRGEQEEKPKRNRRKKQTPAPVDPGPKGILKAKASGPRRAGLGVRFNMKPDSITIPGRGCNNYYHPMTELGSFRLVYREFPGPNVAAAAGSPSAWLDGPSATDLSDGPECTTDEPVLADRWWLVDTGCPYDLTSLDNPANVNEPVQAKRAIKLDTANDEINPDMQVPIQVALPIDTGGYVPLDMKPYGVAKSPDVFGVGHRVEVVDYGFFWTKRHGCHLYLPGGVIEPPKVKPGHDVTLQTVQHVPYFVDKGGGAFNADGSTYGEPGVEPVAAPAPAAASSGAPAKAGHSSDASVTEPSETPAEAGSQAASASTGDDTDDEAEKEKRCANLRQHMLDHAEFDPSCPTCVAAKKTRKQHRKKKNRAKRSPDSEPPKEFGDRCHCDPFHYAYTDKEDPRLDGIAENVGSRITTGIVMYDEGTDFRDVYNKTSKSEAHQIEAFNEWCGPNENIKTFYCDNAPELKSAARLLGWRNPTSTPGISQTNGRAEREVRGVKEGARANLVQSGLASAKWRVYAAKAYCAGRNQRERKSDALSPYQRRHGVPFPGLKIPFGSIVDFQPQPDAEVGRDSFEAKRIPGIFVGYHMLPGGVFGGDYYVVDCTALLANIDAGPTEVKVHRIKEVSVRPTAPTFPIAVKLKRRTETDGAGALLENGQSDDASDGRPPLVESSEDEWPPASSGPAPLARDPDSDSGPGTNAAVPDLRGKGDTSACTGEATRGWTGSTRPPGIDSTLWSKWYTKKDKKECIAVPSSSGARPRTAAKPLV